MQPTALVITVSSRSAAGTRPDVSGPQAVAQLQAAGFSVAPVLLLPDDAAQVTAALRAAVRAEINLVITTGGTGINPTDQTPEATSAVLERRLDGISEELRRRGAAHKSTALLSRGLAGVAGKTLIVNLPGSPNAVQEGLEVVLEIAGHAISQLAGGDH